MSAANVVWFRHGLRLHDSPALLEALHEKSENVALVPIFIFDGESAGTKSVGYNRMRFLLDSLEDIDRQLRRASDGGIGRLLVCRGKPTEIFRKLHSFIPIRKICFEQDCEPIWNERDEAVRALCDELDIDCIERISHTLWDPRKIIKTNGGIPPLTYQMFLHTVQIIGLPPRPAASPDWRGVKFLDFTSEMLFELDAFKQVPKPEELIASESDIPCLTKDTWLGGETQALLLLEERLKVERQAFQHGLYLPNQAIPNILGASKSLSPHLRFGCLSVRFFYWSVHDLFKDVQLQALNVGLPRCPGGAHITGQLIWREYFYTMSVNNPKYDCMEENIICLNIPWAPAFPEQLERWRRGQTGFPLIDAAMRQLLSEGWLHHILRNTVATFLTRGGLWQNWEYGLQHFLKYLLDADWSVCAGNWMWVSSSAFERLLDNSLVTCPIALAKRLDPDGQYVKRFVPELKNVPKEWIHEPWRMPADMQARYDCTIGVQYPARMIDLTNATKKNSAALNALRNSLMSQGDPPPHCRPSSDEEIRQFFWLTTDCN